jgi:hypothetical protein
LEFALSAGMFATVTLEHPGSHGAGTTGRQGRGVKAPNAAAVAEATIGLFIELHIPKGAILTIGLLSIIVAIGVDVSTRFMGKTVKTLGALPKLQLNAAPAQTSCPIIASLIFQYVDLF